MKKERWYRKSKRESAAPGHFPSTLRRPMGPREPSFGNKETEQIPYSRRLDERSDLPPSSPPQRTRSALHAHEYSLPSPSADEVRWIPEFLWESKESEVEQRIVSRKPLAGYDISNSPRRPRSSFRLDSQSRSRSAPRHVERRHSFDLGGFDMGVVMDKFGEQHLEVKRLNAELLAFERQRDDLGEQLSRTTAQLLHLKDVNEDIEQRFEPTSKENKTLKAENERIRKNNSHLHKVVESRDKELRRIQKIVEEQDAKIGKHKAIHQEALDALESKSRREKENMSRLLSNANKAIAAEMKKVDKLRAEEKTLELTLVSYKRRIIEFETTETSKKATIAQLEGEIARSTIAMNKQESDVRKAQDSAFKLMMEPANWQPKPDTEVRRSLDKIAEELWSWTKSCIRKDIDATELKGEVAQQMLRQYSQVHDQRYYFDLEDTRHCAKLPALICMATITSLLYSRLFQNPFFWQSAAMDLDGTSMAVNTYQIYKDALKVDEKGANDWRCQMLRTFDPHISSEESTDPSSKPEQCRSIAVESLIRAFLDSSARTLLDAHSISTEAKLKRLVDITEKAARLSYRLWTQKTRLLIMDLQDIDLGDDHHVKRFENGAELLQHHAYHNFELNRDHCCLDRKPIALMTHPAIVAYGNSSGERYEEYKVWKKAEVWMG